MLCFQALCQIICLYMYFYYFQKSRNVMFLALCQIICLYMYFYYFQKSRNVMFLALCQIICLYMYFYYFHKSRNVMFSGTVSDYLFIYVFLLFPEVQECYVFRHCVRLFVYICISIISRSPGMLCFWHCALCKTGSSQWSVFETDITMSWISTNTRDERVQHYLYLYLYLLTIWIICICIRTRTGRGLTRKWAGFNLEVGRVVLKWAGL